MPYERWNNIVCGSWAGIPIWTTRALIPRGIIWALCVLISESAITWPYRFLILMKSGIKSGSGTDRASCRGETMSGIDEKPREESDIVVAADSE